MRTHQPAQGIVAGEGPMTLKAGLGLVLVWLGIAGVAITLFSNLQLDWADWARWLVTYWRESSRAFWSRLAELGGFHFPTGLVPALNASIALIVTAIGAHIRKHRSRTREYPFQLYGWSLAIFAIIVLLDPGRVHGPLPLNELRAAWCLIFASLILSALLAGPLVLTKHLWFVLFGLCALIGINEAVRLELIPLPQTANTMTWVFV
jgi:hypothetical protein